MTNTSNGPDPIPPIPPFPVEGRLLGLDYGTRRIGFAISTYEQNIASPIANYTLRSESLDARFLREVVSNYRPVGLVVGLPVHVNGEEGQAAYEARQFGAWAADVTGLPITFWDERYTSAVAEEYLLAAEMTRKQRKARLDKMAAQIMLQSYLDEKQRRAGPSSPFV